MHTRLWFFFLVFPLDCCYICASHSGRNTTKPKQDSQYEFKGPQTAQVRAASLYIFLISLQPLKLKEPLFQNKQPFFLVRWFIQICAQIWLSRKWHFVFTAFEKCSRYSFVRQKKERLSQDSVIREQEQLVSCFSWFSKPVTAKKESFSIRHYSS